MRILLCPRFLIKKRSSMFGGGVLLFKCEHRTAGNIEHPLQAGDNHAECTNTCRVVPLSALVVRVHLLAC